MKEALFEYFEWYMSADYSELPECPLLDGADVNFFEGESLDGWFKWRPKDKVEIFEFSELESAYEFTLHESIKTYSNSYWFCQLLVDFNEHSYELFPIVPGNYKAILSARFSGYFSAHDNETTFVPIGLSTSSSKLLIVENKTGKVCVESLNGEREFICESLEAFLIEGE
ncbi:putative Syd protein [Vibrio nigripulchritudo SO65]|uniref:SecY-interacting protein Syd n=1 Tax=Vibrio nigripulchritudo TaxID=28173 RepID=UPI0003B1B226|nr:SecY-interacting protein Syd [Vibrio nigripulchritudo]CCN36813.1 putative Syd protein [Vibrio nigripulchritudo AM115]CCN44589.1 putative Syd protein [Vibrio nigripulchritudo FTn2]CCN66550.1 putative Syd protein [Vibrio nigripulchritudo POn4]CCN76184.1 putative Syd protein [Vibrio nigripulchritudo SO65]